MICGSEEGNLMKKEGPKSQNDKETKAHLEAMVLRTKPESNKWLHLIFNSSNWTRTLLSGAPR